jgi:hypothetical protein
LRVWFSLSLSEAQVEALIRALLDAETAALNAAKLVPGALERRRLEALASVLRAEAKSQVRRVA